MFQISAQIRSNRALQSDVYFLELEAPSIAQKAQPGQFIHIKINTGFDPLLRRPFSLHEINREEGVLGVLYQVVGKGTKLLSQRQAGEKIDLLGPLGKGFSLSFSGDHGVMVGGGIGVAPLFPLAERLISCGKKITVLLGARSQSLILSREKFSALDCRVLVATDDGSLGDKGNVIELLQRYLLDHPADFLYACGPKIVLAKVDQLGLEKGIPGEVSLEAMIGCGVGACLSCSCAKIADEETGKKYAKVCSDGPVFPFGEVHIDGC